MGGRPRGKWKGMALVLCSILLAGCLGGRFEYIGEHPELYSVAISSILGARGYRSGGLRAIQPDIRIVERDRYGRRLFIYGEESVAGHVIIQKVEGDYAYFYPYYNFIHTRLLVDGESFREANSWNLPLSDDSVFVRVRISRHRESGPISNSRLVEAHNQIFPDSTATRSQIVANTFFLRTDNYGRSIYARKTGEWEADGSWSLILVAILFQPNHSFDLETGALEIIDRRYQTELREFMEANGWDTPFEE